MTALWRLYRAQHGPGLDGIGGTFADGRWHTRGERVVYFGASPAIVVLERLAHADPDLLPDDLRLAEFAFDKPPSQSNVADYGSLPSTWTRDQKATRLLGARWRKYGSTCLLLVPSAILPEESNIVFNPQHPDSTRLILVRERPFAFDRRLI